MPNGDDQNNVSERCWDREHPERTGDEEKDAVVCSKGRQGLTHREKRPLVVAIISTWLRTYDGSPGVNDKPVAGANRAVRFLARLPAEQG